MADQFEREWGLVLLGQMLLKGEHDAVGDDRRQHHVLERRERARVKD